MLMLLYGSLTAFLLSLPGLPALTPSQDGCKHSCLSQGICNATRLAKTCYFTFFDANRTWGESRKLCKMHNMTMAKLSKQVIQDTSNLQHLANGSGSPSGVWLGGRVRQLNDWTFVNGDPLDKRGLKLHAHFNDSERSLWHLCGTILRNGQELVVVTIQCPDINPFICRFDTQTGSHHLYISMEFTDWFEARSRCLALGADLFFPKQQQDMDNLKNKLASFENMEFFIGLRHEVWEWEDGEEIQHYNWDKKSNLSDERCLMMHNTGNWSDARCSSKVHTLCQEVTQNASNSRSVSSTVRKDNNRFAIIFILGGLLIIAVLVIVILLFHTIKTHLTHKSPSRKTMASYWDVVLPYATPMIQARDEVPADTEFFLNPLYTGLHNMIRVDGYSEESSGDTEIEDNPCYSSVVVDRVPEIERVDVLIHQPFGNFDIDHTQVDEGYTTAHSEFTDNMG